MDLRLRGQVVWVLAPATRAVWNLAEAFLEEAAFVCVVTTESEAGVACSRLQLRFGQNLRVVMVGRQTCLLSKAFVQPLLQAGVPNTIVLLQTAGQRSDPTAHDWDEFLRSRAAEMRDGGTIVVVSPHGTIPGDAPDEFASWVQSVRRQGWTWSALTPDRCAVSFIGAALDLSADPASGRPSENQEPVRAWGLPALAAFMASRGRGLTAVVTSDGSAHFV
ncbi:MAG TPA: hypothetical protein VHZ26_02180 [Caulobacteraceae bacterium]|jgi:hypothetical protein|nr:hypothetical protein [Caulobacteraceae bacterium]